MLWRCEKCGTKYNLQRHHISYNPPNVIILCKECHKEVHKHKHGVGRISPYQRTLRPYKIENGLGIFVAYVQACTRFAIPEEVHKALDIKPGDYVEVRVKKLSIKPKGYPLTR
jgi:hypothetical protein